MLKNNRITKKKLSERTGKAIVTIQRYINRLANMGIIERKGSRKSGYWNINK